MRIRSVGTLCILAFIFLCFMADFDQRTEVGVLRWFGLALNQDVVKHTLMVLLLNSILFAGEIYQIAKGMTHLRYELNSIITQKNLFWAPLFEEFIYRSILINLFIESGAFTPTKCVLITPLYFAISHLHQVFE